MPLGVERQEERQAAQDRRRLHGFVELVQPVTELSVSCRLGGQEIGSTISRDAFVDLPPRGTVTAFIRWGANPWPATTPEEAEALATALADLVGTGHLEAFLALINAGSHESRLKLLRLAGASTALEGSWTLDETEERTSEEAGTDAQLKTPGEVSTEEVSIPPTAAEQSSQRIKTPLFRPEQLLVDGVPVFIAGERSEHRSTGDGHRGGNGAGAAMELATAGTPI